MIMRAAFCITIACSAAASAARTGLGSLLADPVWLVQPATDQGTEITVHVGEWISKTAVVPGGVSELAGDARDGKGRFLALRGDELFLRLVNGEQAYCTYSTRKPGVTIGKIGSAVTDPCFIDRDNNGDFEIALRIRMPPPATIFSIAPVREQAAPIPPVSYRKLDPSQTKHAYVVGVKFDGVYLGGAPVFKLFFGSGGDGIPIITSAKLARDGKAEIFGASYTVLSRDKKVMRVRVDKAIPAQPFILSTGVS